VDAVGGDRAKARCGGAWRRFWSGRWPFPRGDDSGLEGGGQLEAGLEDVGVQCGEEGLVVVILDVDGEALEGDALRANVEAAEDGVARDACPLVLADAVGGVEVQVLGIVVGDVVLSIEVEEDAVGQRAFAEQFSKGTSFMYRSTIPPNEVKPILALVRVITGPETTR
jgi:hypothetical protein